MTELRVINRRSCGEPDFNPSIVADVTIADMRCYCGNVPFKGVLIKCYNGKPIHVTHARELAKALLFVADAIEKQEAYP